MTTATQTRSWQREPVGDPAPPDGPPAAPSLFPLLDWLVNVHGGKSLSVSNLWHDRPVRGGSVPSSHRGAAFDWRYEDPGKGRQYMLTNVLADLIVYSLELNVQQIHDYVGCRVWKASRSGDSNGGWVRQNPGSHSGMMGAPWAQWLHVEAGEWAWTDDRPVPDKLGPTTEGDWFDMATEAELRAIVKEEVAWEIGAHDAKEFDRHTVTHTNIFGAGEDDILSRLERVEDKLNRALDAIEALP